MKEKIELLTIQNDSLETTLQTIQNNLDEEKMTYENIMKKFKNKK